MALLFFRSFHIIEPENTMFSFKLNAAAGNHQQKSNILKSKQTLTKMYLVTSFKIDGKFICYV